MPAYNGPRNPNPKDGEAGIIIYGAPAVRSVFCGTELTSRHYFRLCSITSAWNYRSRLLRSTPCGAPRPARALQGLADLPGPHRIRVRHGSRRLWLSPGLALPPFQSHQLCAAVLSDCLRALLQSSKLPHTSNLTCLGADFLLRSHLPCSRSHPSAHGCPSRILSALSARTRDEYVPGLLLFDH